MVALTRCEVLVIVIEAEAEHLNFQVMVNHWAIIWGEIVLCVNPPDDKR